MKTNINALVTGAQGQLGLSLKDESKLHPDINFYFLDASELDVRNIKEVESALKMKDFDFCINCAAYTNVEMAESEQDRAFDVNYEGVRNIVNALKRETTTLIHISTDYVFDGKKNSAYTEDDATNPINIYGKSKLAGEEYIQENFKDHFIIRTSWLYSQYGNNFLKTVVSKLTNGESMNINDDQKGVPTGCIALSKFIISLIKNKSPEFGVYHFTPSGETNWYEFGVEISKILGKHNIKAPLIRQDNTFKTVAKRPENSILDNRKAKKIFPEIKNWKVEVGETIKILLSKK